jgi:hypothetical protein
MTLTRSKTGAGPTLPRQLALPGAPKLDRTGVHAVECECARCGLGYRPSKAERELARQHYDRAEQRRKEEAARVAAGDAPPVSPAEVKHQRAAERLKHREAETREYLAALHRPVVRPATPEELDELKRLHGFKTRKG